MSIYRRAIALLCCLIFAQPAFALTPSQRAALFGSSVPAWVLQGAGVPATQDFDFANGRYYQQGRGRNLAALLNTSRASAGAAVSSTGVWTQFTDNTPRITDLGILIEEARTNGLQNSSMQGAVPGVSFATHWGITNAGLTTSLTAVGVQNGIEYSDMHLSGTPTGTNFFLNFQSPVTAIAALQNQVWNDSVFLAIVGGDLTHISAIKLEVNENSSAPAFLTSHVSSDIKASIPASLNASSRLNFTTTLTNASCAFANPLLFITLTIGQAVDITLRIGWPQLEQGSTITSPIRTTTAAVTRAADLVTPASLPTFGSAWSFFVNGTISEVSAVRSLLGTSVANTQPIYSPTSNTLADANNGSVALAATAGSGGWTTGAKVASGFSSTGRSIVMNNGTVATDANTHIAPVTLYLGATAGTVAGVKTISRMATWANTRLGDTTLKGLTP